jgi:hypothetical protein
MCSGWTVFEGCGTAAGRRGRRRGDEKMTGGG